MPEIIQTAIIANIRYLLQIRKFQQAQALYDYHQGLNLPEDLKALLTRKTR